MHKTEKAAVFILLGQSNAVGHALPMREADKITEPLTNVFGLCRKENQSFDVSRLSFSGYTSGGMNLGEAQDHTYSVANCLARIWQDEIDAGNPRNLPDLYIVHIAIGAQGVTEGYMWHPAYERKLVPGVQGIVDIALTPFTNHILSLLEKSFAEMGKPFEVMGIHWRGSENDALASWEVLEKTGEHIHKALFEGFTKSIGRIAPVILHLRASEERCMERDPSGEMLRKVRYINGIFEKLAAEYENISLFDIKNCPLYRQDVSGNGIFIEDHVHYTHKANLWTAEEILRTYPIQFSAR